jgi:hypothetical protein
VTRLDKRTRRWLVALAVVVVIASTIVALIARGDDDEPVAGSWTKVSAPGPSERWGRGVAVDQQSQRAYAFAGAGDRFYADLWQLDLTSLQWELLDAGTTEPAPPPRWTPVLFVDQPRNRLVAFGGFDSKAALSDVWSFDLTARRWQRLADGPSARYDHDGAFDEAAGRAWVFGGYDASNQPLDDLWQFTFATNEWAKIETASGRPAPRTNAAFAHIGSGKLLLFGGHELGPTNPDSWVFDLEKRTWTQFRESMPPLAWAHFAQTPDVRCHSLFLFGGDNNDQKDTAQLLELRAGKSEIRVREVPVNDQPPARRHASLVIDQNRRRLVMFGGWSGESTLYADLWTAPIKSDC